MFSRPGSVSGVFSHLFPAHGDCTHMGNPRLRVLGVLLENTALIMSSFFSIFGFCILQTSQTDLLIYLSPFPISYFFKNILLSGFLSGCLNSMSHTFYWIFNKSCYTHTHSCKYITGMEICVCAHTYTSPNRHNFSLQSATAV